MNYAEFYEKATAELKSTFLFLNAKGDASYRDHISDMLDAEPLVREPIFQSIFPWESDTHDMQSLSAILGNDLINALDTAHFQDPLVANAPKEPQDFPRTRHPFKHQVKAWRESLINNKSILVTTGTGSGKTECFMIPVLKELYDCRCIASQTGASVGIQAIFLYPLNALIASQRKRVHAWAQNLPQQVTYCNYNGELPSSESAVKRAAAYPQIIDRQSLRQTPPQILFTNPSMLEYMMVRTADQNLKQNSDLKWIVLDEAHCYNGSSATELAMQIRRILKFFGKKPNEVKFAITSATVSTDPQKQVQMHHFIEELTGKSWANEFVEIGGQRVVDALDYANSGTQTTISKINAQFGLSLNPAQIDKLRMELNANPSLSLDKIIQDLGMATNAPTSDKIKLVDCLSTKDPIAPAMTKAGILPASPTALLPTRAHFNVRSVEGVYACTNPQCVKHNAYRPLSLGRLTTYKSSLCPDCGGQMLEVVRCSQCHELLLQGLRVPSQTPGAPDSYKMMQMEHIDDMLVDFSSKNASTPANALLFDAVTRITVPPLPSHMIVSPMPIFSLDALQGKVVSAGVGQQYIECIKGDKCVCPKCGERQSEMKPLMMMPNMIQTHLAHILLHQSDTPASISSSMSYDGRKYISFTDNRQKTASTARIQNVDTQRGWIRGAIYHALADNISNTVINGQTIQQIQSQITTLAAMNNPIYLPIIQNLQSQVAQAGLMNSQSVKNKYIGDSELLKLHKRYTTPLSVNDYLLALILDQMGTRSLRTSSSLESLGMVHWVYPAIDGLSSAPASFVSFYGYSSPNDPAAVTEWKNLLRILLDVTIRGGRHIEVPAKVDDILPHSFASRPIYASNAVFAGKNQYATWLKFDRTAKEYRREFILLLLAKGITDSKAVTAADETAINDILKDAWTLFTTANVLTQNGLNNGYYGYKLDLFANNSPAMLTLQQEGMVCPVTKQIIEVTFRGLSPMIKGELCKETLQRYTVHSQKVSIPVPGFSRMDQKYMTTGRFDIDLWHQDIEQWLKNTYIPTLQNVWGDLNSQASIINFDKIYLAKEHSAQLDSDELRESERKFINGELNVLDCSTTMEMGVDIGGLSVVTMNNVAPKPQNYQQRVGRAGRRGEQKAMAMTIYGDNPIGRSIEQNPSWALSHPIEPSALSFASENIVSRHVCATLFAAYLSTTSVSLKDRLGDFVMGVDQNGIAANYSYNGYIGFLNTLRNGINPNQIQIEQDCRDLTHGTCLQSSSFNDLIDSALNGIKEICNQVSSFFATLNAQMAAAVLPKYQKKLEITKKNLWEKNLFSYLGEKDYVPNAYMPTNVTDLILQQTGNKKTSNPQRETQLAISEYAPGQEVVVDEMIYRSIGIAMQTNNGNPNEEYISTCSCGYVTKQALAINGAQCPNCGSALRPLFNGQALQVTTCIEPLAFYADEPTWHRSNTSMHSRRIRPALLDTQPWPNNLAGQVYNVRTTFGNSSVLYVNEGMGQGYALCPWCGRMEPETAIVNGGNTNLNGVFSARTHQRPDSGAACGNKTIHRNVVLSSEIKTNLTEIRIAHHRVLSPEEQQSLLNSLGTVMSRKFAEMLGVEDNEIDYGTIDANTFFIFDTHCGGSCYSNRLTSLNLLEQLFDNCRAYLKNCNCAKSCTHCLVDRRSQYRIDELDRQLAIDWLDWEYSNRNIVPQSLNNRFPQSTITKITVPLDNFLSLQFRQGNFVKVAYFMNSHRTLSADVYDQVKRDMIVAQTQGKSVTLLVSQQQSKNLSLQALCDLQAQRGIFEENVCSWPIIPALYPIATIDNDLIVMYINNTQEDYYRISNYMSAFILTSVAPFNPQIMLAGRGTCTNRVHRSIDIDNYLDNILGKDAINLDNYFASNNYRGQTVNIEYTDLYVNNPATCILLCNVIKQFVERYNLSINQITINCSNKFKSNAQSVTMNDDFNNAYDRDTYLSKCAHDILSKTVHINTQGYFQHDRPLLIKGISSNLSVEIEPNGGFGHGWVLEDPTTKQPASISDPVDDPFFMFNSKRSVGIKFTFAWT